MAQRRKTRRRSDAAARIRHLIALDATNVVRHLGKRREEMVSLFSRLRDREPMLLTVRSWFESVDFEALVTLHPDEQRAVNDFHHVLGELRWYLRYTEDMPSTVRTIVTQHARALEAEYVKLISVLGDVAAEAKVVVDAEVVREPPPPELPALTKRNG
jgi:hypothetical protein